MTRPVTGEVVRVDDALDGVADYDPPVSKAQNRSVAMADVSGLLVPWPFRGIATE